MAYSYFKGPVFLFFGILILLVVILDVVGVSLGILSTMVILIYALGGFILGWVVLFLRSGLDDRYVGRDVTDVYYLDFLIEIIFNKVTLFSIL